ncbi:MAG: hypothetical protein M0O96_08190 [Desulforhopalus sp.]|nr:hypothetical protein [Desulforhopalus sp.]
MKKDTVLLLNILFVALAGVILIFLFNAPEVTTPHVPKDENHQKFFTMHKKEAEKQCEQCHAQGKEYPLSEDHPPKYRCLLCHIRK